jgi:hypothetical protein
MIAALMLIAAAFFIADAVSKREAAQLQETVLPEQESSGCAGGSISFVQNEDGSLIVSCPQGVEK